MFSPSENDLSALDFQAPSERFFTEKALPPPVKSVSPLSVFPYSPYSGEPVLPPFLKSCVGVVEKACESLLYLDGKYWERVDTQSE
jgi:hypothetical protein